MKPVVDIIATVIASMRPTFDTSPSRAGQVVTFTDVSKVTHKLFVGERLKVKDGSADGGWHYGTVITIVDEYTFTATFTGLADDSIGNPEVVLTYDYGNRETLVTRFNEMSQHPVYKFEMFPAIILFQPFEETVENDGYDREVTLNIVILTDSKQEFSYADRYTYNFKPRLYLLEARLIDRLKWSNEVTADFKLGHGRMEWPGERLGDNKTPLFNDFIDAIEWKNFKTKII